MARNLVTKIVEAYMVEGFLEPGSHDPARGVSPSFAALRPRVVAG